MLDYGMDPSGANTQEDFLRAHETCAAELQERDSNKLDTSEEERDSGKAEHDRLETSDEDMAEPSKSETLEEAWHIQGKHGKHRKTKGTKAGRTTPYLPAKPDTAASQAAASQPFGETPATTAKEAGGTLQGETAKNKNRPPRVDPGSPRYGGTSRRGRRCR